MKNYVQRGENIDYVATGQVRGGELVVKGALAGLAIADIAPGEIGVIVTEGVFDIAKEAGALAVGAVAYAPEGEGVEVSDDDAGTRVGVVIVAAENTATVARVKLG